MGGGAYCLRSHPAKSCCTPIQCGQRVLAGAATAPVVCTQESTSQVQAMHSPRPHDPDALYRAHLCALEKKLRSSGSDCKSCTCADCQDSIAIEGSSLSGAGDGAMPIEAAPDIDRPDILFWRRYEGGWGPDAGTSESVLAVAPVVVLLPCPVSDVMDLQCREPAGEITNSH